MGQYIGKKIHWDGASGVWEGIITNVAGNWVDIDLTIKPTGIALRQITLELSDLVPSDDGNYIVKL